MIRPHPPAKIKHNKKIPQTSYFLNEIIHFVRYTVVVLVSFLLWKLLYIFVWSRCFCVPAVPGHPGWMPRYSEVGLRSCGADNEEWIWG